MPIYALGHIEPTIDPSAYVHPDAVVIGDVTLGEEASVWPGAVLRGDPGGIVIGARTSVQDGTVVHTTPYSPTRVGADCVVGHNVHLEGCRIDDGCLIGSGAVVLAGAVVESGALVGAGALVNGGLVVPAGAMALGVPAKVRLDAVNRAHHIDPGVEVYRERARTYRVELRRLD
ncbi:MAG TPA: gamma carbonic anhydrase family protein [Acidimicrobiales bacterium]|nr:gamma carbonic anhydrase family protein [Acidimicrobiales bacterium]